MTTASEDEAKAEQLRSELSAIRNLERELERTKGLLQNETGKNEIAQRDIIALKMELDAVIRQNEERKRALDCIGIVASLARPK
jgi:chromosome segregation ATPase